MSGGGEGQESPAIARAADAADELYRVRDTYFSKDPAEKLSRLQALADTALSILDSLPAGRPQISFLSLSLCLSDLYMFHCHAP